MSDKAVTEILIVIGALGALGLIAFMFTASTMTKAAAQVAAQ